MTAGQALTILKMKPSATTEEIRLACNKMVRRSPPEFHPERFREIDEAYRFLTSFTHTLERLFSGETSVITIEGGLLSFDIPSPASSLDDVVAQSQKKFKTAYLWGAIQGKPRWKIFLWKKH